MNQVSSWQSDGLPFLKQTWSSSVLEHVAFISVKMTAWPSAWFVSVEINTHSNFEKCAVRLTDQGCQLMNRVANRSIIPRTSYILESLSCILVWPSRFWKILRFCQTSTKHLLWLPCVADVDIIFLPRDFYLSSFFPRLISASADWMSTILRHMMSP